MNELESQQATAHELVSFAEQQGFEFGLMCHNWAFLNEGRFISLWRKQGMVHYNLQGRTGKLPERYRSSADSFNGMWHEAGTLANAEQAFGLLKAWLIDGKGADDLPQRQVRREGLG
jgi:hypothetical protein